MQSYILASSGIGRDWGVRRVQVADDIVGLHGRGKDRTRVRSSISPGNGVLVRFPGLNSRVVADVGVTISNNHVDPTMCRDRYRVS